jgi:xanthine dehydrogenase accessory factor
MQCVRQSLEAGCALARRLPDPVMNAGAALGQVRAVVRGVGEIGSAIAHGLHRAGAAVVIQDHPAPSTSRRGMAFVDVMYDGVCVLEGLAARRADNLMQLGAILGDRAAIPLAPVSIAELCDYFRPNVFIDARVSRRRRPQPFIHLAPHTIGIGPNLMAGIDSHAVIESAWGEQLGAVILNGCTMPHRGDPPSIGGYARERFVYAPCAGRFHSDRRIGDHVCAGEQVAWIDGTPLSAPLTGCLRGLTRSGVPVSANERVVEIIPEGSDAQIFGLGERPRAIAQGVASALGILLARTTLAAGK